MSTYLHQLKTANNPIDGMSYVIISDGSVVVIDGGCDGGDAEILLEHLKKYTGKDIPVVDAWFITHAHMDHTFCMIGMGERHSSQIRVKKLIFSQPPAWFLNTVEPAAQREMVRMEKAVANFEGMERITPLAGESYVFGSARFDILFTWRDLKIESGCRGLNVNNTSTVIRLTAEGQTVLFLGDAESEADRILIKYVGAGLKSDVCQVAHHGGYGTTIETYRLIDPEILLWPLNSKDIDSLLYIVPADRELVGPDMHVKEVILHGDGTRVMKMPIRPSAAPRDFTCALPTDEELRKILFDVPFKAGESLVSPSDPFWDDVDEITDFYTLAGSRDGESASMKVCRADGGVRVRVALKGMKTPAPSDPGRFSTDNCCNVRIHFSEEPAEGLIGTWVTTQLINGFRDLRLFGEKKLIGGRECFNSMPDRFDSLGEITPDGFAVSVFIPFVKKHAAGDVIALHAEVNVVPAGAASRTLSLGLIKPPFGDRYRFFPGGVSRARLV